VQDQAAARSVLKRKLGFSAAAWRDVDALIMEVASATPRPPRSIDAVTGDPADDVILATAVAANAEVLVSGDTRHLLPVGAHEGVRILKPQGLLTELSGA
jgi:predicted nucleic acid-binding protein